MLLRGQLKPAVLWSTRSDMRALAESEHLLVDQALQLNEALGQRLRIMDHLDVVERAVVALPLQVFRRQLVDHGPCVRLDLIHLPPTGGNQPLHRLCRGIAT